jgi:hypothetical protein
VQLFDIELVEISGSVVEKSTLEVLDRLELNGK